MTVLTWEQSIALAEAHPARYRPMIYLAIDTGMRWSELVGLRRMCPGTDAVASIERRSAQHRVRSRDVAPETVVASTSGWASGAG